MAFEDNHNHFCIYCGAKLIPNQHFCTQCGKNLYGDDGKEIHVSSEYDEEIFNIENEYVLKQAKATQIVEKLFNPSDIEYTKFNQTILRSNSIFKNQLDVVKKMCELGIKDNKLVENEIKNKIKILYSLIDKMNDLINEMVINLSSNKKDEDEVNNLFSDMDDLINSVKNY